MALGGLSCLTAADAAVVLALAKRRRYAAGESILEEGVEQQADVEQRAGRVGRGQAGFLVALDQPER